MSETRFVSAIFSLSKAWSLLIYYNLAFLRGRWNDLPCKLLTSKAESLISHYVRG